MLEGLYHPFVNNYACFKKSGLNKIGFRGLPILLVGYIRTGCRLLFAIFDVYAGIFYAASALLFVSYLVWVEIGKPQKKVNIGTRWGPQLWVAS